MTTIDPRVEAYRAAAAKLGEALAATEHPERTIPPAVSLLGGDAAAGIQVCADEYDHYYRYHRRAGWRWITQAAQLRLLVEAELLAQASQREPYLPYKTDPVMCSCGATAEAQHAADCPEEECPFCGYKVRLCGCWDRHLGALVREWREGGKGT